MDKKWKDSQTYQNLKKAYEGELKASGKYRIYAQKAEKDGYRQIHDIFTETAGNEQEHAEIWLELLNSGSIPNTLENLREAYKGEKYEWTQMYQEFAKKAAEEGYYDISKLFHKVAEIEKHHDYRYERLAQNIMEESVFCKKRENAWICLNCGYIFYGSCAPDKCPVCGFLQGYYQLNCENY
ncbi:MAG: ferritin family protein [Lachnospiraceae bacterium]